MPGRSNPDLTNTLTMLHTAVMHTDKSFRDELDKSVEKLEAANQAAHSKTAKELVDELSRMRANFREVYNKLNSNGEALNSAVQDVVAQLRSELRAVRSALADLTPEPPPLTGPLSPTPHSHEESGVGRGDTSLTAAVAVAEPAESQEKPDLTGAIPAQRSAAKDAGSGPVLSAEMVRQAVREVLIEELAPMLAPPRTGESPADRQQDVPGQLQEAAGEIRQEFSTVLEEARAELTSVRKQVSGLRTVVEELLPRPDTTAAGIAAAEVGAEHSALLRTAARVSSTGLLCHRDIWEFLTARAGQHPHFRVPPQVVDEGDERIRAALSGRSLIALLISLHSIQHTASEGDGDQELAATVYERIEKSLTGLTSSGEPVTITLDDRTRPAPNTQTAETTDEPTDTNAEPNSSEQAPGPDEEPSPTTV
ncbi:hypothetical protein [Streptomyces sp. NPDC006925]|uniref:hypothetical protein n=1 Tax=Streptomyces sp. NPDC006925 TaxID=3364768 RepID=UPI0036B8196E